MPKIIRPDVKVEVSVKMRSSLMEDVRRRVREANNIVGYDPVVESALIATHPDLAKNYELRLRANAMVAEYFHPKLNRTEISGPDGGPIETKGSDVEKLLEAVEDLVRQNGAKINA